MQDQRQKRQFFVFSTTGLAEDLGREVVPDTSVKGETSVLSESAKSGADDTCGTKKSPDLSGLSNQTVFSCSRVPWTGVTGKSLRNKDFKGREKLLS